MKTERATSVRAVARAASILNTHAMPRVTVALMVALTLVTVGCGDGRRGHGGARTTSPAYDAARAQMQRVLRDAATPRRALPAYKIRAADAAGLTGLDLWNAVVDPMIDDLTPLDGTPELRRRLNREQYAVYVLFALDTDIDDGGISEVYFNSSGVFAGQGVALLRQVGAPQHARVLARANRVIDPHGRVPVDRAARQRRLRGVDDARFTDLDDAWSALPALDELVARYVRAHPRAFFV